MLKMQRSLNIIFGWMDICLLYTSYLWKKNFDVGVLKRDNFLVLTAAIRKKDLIEAGMYDLSLIHILQQLQ